MVARQTLAIVVVFVVLTSGVVFLGFQVSDLGWRVNELAGQLERLNIVMCRVTIDYGTENELETVWLPKGATALDALRRVAAVETTFYAGLGEVIHKIKDVGGDPGKYWAFYYWGENDWIPGTQPGTHELRNVDDIMFVYMFL